MFTYVTFMVLCCTPFKNLLVHQEENSMKMPKFLPGRQRYEIDDDLNTISRAKMRSVQQTVVIVLTYFLSSTPFICAQLWAVWGKPSQAVSK